MKKMKKNFTYNDIYKKNKSIVYALYKNVILYEEQMKKNKPKMFGKIQRFSCKHGFIIKDPKNGRIIHNNWLSANNLETYQNLYQNVKLKIGKEDKNICLFYNNTKTHTNQISNVIYHIRNSFCHILYEKITIRNKQFLVFRDKTKTGKNSMVLQIQFKDLKPFLEAAYNCLKIENFD